jgi:hypothetical protein
LKGNAHEDGRRQYGTTESRAALYRPCRCFVAFAVGSYTAV